MSVRVVDNHPAIAGKIQSNIPLFLRSFGDAVLLRANSKTPWRKGFLRQETKVTAIGNKGQIKWSAPYAAFQERGYTTGPIRKYTTPGTGAHFAENAVRGELPLSEIHAKKAGLL